MFFVPSWECGPSPDSLGFPWWSGLDEVKCGRAFQKWSVSLPRIESLLGLFVSYGRCNWQTGWVSLPWQLVPICPLLVYTCDFVLTFRRDITATNAVWIWNISFWKWYFILVIKIHHLKGGFIKTPHFADTNWFKPSNSLNSKKLSKSKPLGSIHSSLWFFLKHLKRVRKAFRIHVLF